MKAPLDELYFEWLYGQVGDTRATNPTRTYWTLLRQLYTSEFVWIVPNDDNRIEDGKDLRQEFVDELELRAVDRAWMELGCSVLEMLVALSRRLAFEGEGQPEQWFWVLLKNLSLRTMHDQGMSSARQHRIQEIIDKLIWRTYNYDGSGGLFPLQRPEHDQRKVEIWYQLCAYIVEQRYQTEGG